MNALTDLEFRLLNDWQRDFPLTARPFAELARRLDASEAQVLASLAELKTRGHLSRIGAVFRPHILGWSTLAAVAAPPEHMERVAQLICEFPEVNHNYEREHVYNLWFVVTAASQERVSAVLAEIQRQTGLKPLDLPMLEDYHIDLGFDLSGAVSPHAGSARPLQDLESLRQAVEPVDYCLAAALEPGLPLTSRPYERLAAACGMSESALLERIGALQTLGIMRRFGVVVRHRELGYRANAMVVWDVPDAEVAKIGRRLGEESSVTLCYRRPRRLPDWPYNLFSMVHGRDRASVLDALARIRNRLGLETVRHQPLFSLRRFKQCGAHYASLAQAKAA
ncbi:AsnC family transcriptional regulator [Sulfuritortus calidifontis]|uniref:siroheme decarboxylase n=1 Tax=Sulfuritortus calidifontis TaxID=1914471 RepID=A0A4R3JYH2_9PROT|nr:Lrp/AsnC family transcriptional regulator [Sulfuritortus calidifontis]TCS73853.1 AsnC family transcriptional regulator [Sulfuritortus calidifontis]